MALCGEMKFSGIAMAMATPMVMCSKAIALSMDQDVGARCQASCTYCLVSIVAWNKSRFGGLSAWQRALKRVKSVLYSS